uniref:Uncharacterized protein n=1 Tax=Solanum lycopersicum TaxID=4081 RepID=A0A3Q7G3J0_SOLLC
MTGNGEERDIRTKGSETSCYPMGPGRKQPKEYNLIQTHPTPKFAKTTLDVPNLKVAERQVSNVPNLKLDEGQAAALAIQRSTSSLRWPGYNFLNAVKA